MTLVDADTGEIVDSVDYLEALASRVRVEHRRSRAALGEAVDAYFAIGQCLLEARSALSSDEAFGAWFNAQEFGFTTQWGRLLRLAADHESAVRAAVESQLSTGSTSVNFEQTVKQVTAGGASRPKPGGDARRTALIQDVQRAGHELLKAVERIERIYADDRYFTNREQVAVALDGPLAHAIQVLSDLSGKHIDQQEDR